MATESLWCWPLSAWLSSGTACFLFFNAIVCVVAVLSWGRRGGDATLSTRRRRLTRSASSMVMERLRSVSSTIFSFQYPAADYDSIAPQLHHVQQEYYCYTSQEEGEMRPAVSEVEPEPAVPLPPVESMAATMAPSAPVAAAAEVCPAVSTSGSDNEEEDAREEMSTPPAAAAAKGAATLERPRKTKWKVAGIVERRAYTEMAEKAEVNARAERFIRQFREDLKLERASTPFSSVGAIRAARSEAFPLLGSRTVGSIESVL